MEVRTSVFGGVVDGGLKVGFEKTPLFEPPLACLVLSSLVFGSPNDSKVIQNLLWEPRKHVVCQWLFSNAFCLVLVTPQKTSTKTSFCDPW